MMLYKVDKLAYLDNIVFRFSFLDTNESVKSNSVSDLVKHFFWESSKWFQDIENILKLFTYITVHYITVAMIKVMLIQRAHSPQEI